MTSSFSIFLFTILLVLFFLYEKKKKQINFLKNSYNPFVLDLYKKEGYKELDEIPELMLDKYTKVSYILKKGNEFILLKIKDEKRKYGFIKITEIKEAISDLFLFKNKTGFEAKLIIVLNDILKIDENTEKYLSFFKEEISVIEIKEDKFV